MTLRRLLPVAILAAALEAGAAPAQTPPPPPPPGHIVVEDLPAAATPGTPQEPTGDAALEAEAQREYADGNLQRALEIYANLASRASDPAERARLGVTAAWLSFQVGDRAGAAEALGRLLYDRPDAPFRAETYDPQFVALYQDALRDATERRSRDATAKTGEAVAAIRAGRYDEARRTLGEALILAPDDPRILYDLALVDARQGRADGALAGFEKVLALGRAQPGRVPGDLRREALNGVAVLYFARADYGAARTALEEALKIDPDDARALYNLGLTRRKLGDAEGGYAALRRARELDPRDTDVAVALGGADIERGQWVEAVALLLEASRDRPEDPEVWLQLGRAQRGLGNDAGALDSLAAAGRLDSGNRHGIAAISARMRAEILRARGDAAGAAAAAGDAVAAAADDVDAWMLLGLARLDGGDAAGARTALEKARALAPRRADVAHNLGSVCLVQHDLDAAEAAFRAELELDPDNADARSVLDRIAAQRAAAAQDAQPEGKRATRPAPTIGAKMTSVDYAPLGIRGLRVDSIAAGGAAARAGLAAGDLVLRVDGKPAGTAEQLLARAKSRREGVVLDVLRSGVPVALRLKLD